MEALQALRHARTAPAQPKRTAVLSSVTAQVTRPESVTTPVTHCPTCGHKIGKLTPAEKQRAYRQRKAKA